MIYGETIVHVKAGSGYVGISWMDDKKVHHGKMLKSLKEAVEALNNLMEKGETIKYFNFHYDEIRMRISSEDVNIDPIMSALPHTRCITLISEHKE